MCAIVLSGNFVGSAGNVNVNLNVNGSLGFVLCRRITRQTA
jgi:hypothetical protein